MPAEEFLQWLLRFLCYEAIPNPGVVAFPSIDTPELKRVTDAVAQALELVRADPAQAERGVPQPTLGYTIRCWECNEVRWTGIAFSRYGASALLHEHQNSYHVHSHV